MKSRSFTAKYAPKLSLEGYFDLLGNFFDVNKVDDYTLPVSNAAMLVMSFVFPRGYYGTKFSELVILGLSEAIFFRSLAWRAWNPDALEMYIQMFVPE